MSARTLPYVDGDRMILAGQSAGGMVALYTAGTRTPPGLQAVLAFAAGRGGDPDINPGDRLAEDRFKRITEAYDILSDPLKREFYDVNGFYTDGVLEQRGAGSNWGFSFQGFDFSSSRNADSVTVTSSSVRPERSRTRGSRWSRAMATFSSSV